MGDTPGQNWWVVAAATSMSFPPYRLEASLLTNSHMWIDVTDYDSVGQRGHWDNVSWLGERLSRGLQAQKKALSCLPNA